MAAAVAARRALDAALRREYAGWPRHELTLERLRLAHDGAYEWITDGRNPVARLHRPAADTGRGSPRGESYAIELVLPSFASEGVTIAAAQCIARAVGGDASPAAPGLRHAESSGAAAPARG
jgi:hypothetical protein